MTVDRGVAKSRLYIHLTMKREFRLKGGCKLVLQQGNIVQWRVNGTADAIVNATNESMLGGEGPDGGAIHRAAGPDLHAACKRLPFVRGNIRCLTGEAIDTPAFRLPVSRIIHTVGPVYDPRDKRLSAAALAASYRNSLDLARERGIKQIAFPTISCGVSGYPLKQAGVVATRTMKENCDGLSEVHFVVSDKSTMETWIEAIQETLAED